MLLVTLKIKVTNLSHLLLNYKLLFSRLWYSLSMTKKRSICPVACTLDILGDKWTLLVIRDLLLGKKTYSDFQDSPEKIPTNILADRLKRLQEQDLIYKVPYQNKPPRFEYVLTDSGKELKSVLLEMVTWGEKHIKGTQARYKGNSTN